MTLAVITYGASTQTPHDLANATVSMGESTGTGAVVLEGCACGQNSLILTSSPSIPASLFDAIADVLRACHRSEAAK